MQPPPCSFVLHDQPLPLPFHHTKPTYRSLPLPTTFHGIRSDDLTRDQARSTRNKIEPMLQYLVRLNKRMGFRGIPADDPLKVAGANALTAMHELHTEVQCRSIDGKGRSEGRSEVAKPPADLLFTRRSKARRHEGR